MQVSSATSVARLQSLTPSARPEGPGEVENDGDSDDRGSLAFMGVGSRVDTRA